LGNYPEENIQHTEHSESLKSRITDILQTQENVILHSLHFSQDPYIYKFTT